MAAGWRLLAPGPTQRCSKPARAVYATHRTMIQQLKSEHDFEQVLQSSFQRPVFVFKHSSYCGVSSYAWKEFQRYAAEEPAAEYWKVLVIEDRKLSKQIAASAGVPHESPQVILLCQGKAVWHASHHQITARLIKGQFQKNRPIGLQPSA